MNKALFILHLSPPVHGASKVGDSILNSSIIKENLNSRFIKIKSSDSIEVIGKFNFKKIVYFVELLIKVCWILIWFRPRKIYYTASPFGFAFYRDLMVSLPIKMYAKVNKASIFYHYHAKGINDFVSKSNQNLKLTNFLLRNTNILLISKLMQNEINQINSYKNVFFISNGVENTLSEDFFKNILSQRKSNNMISVLYLSNMMRDKGYDTVLDIAFQCKQAHITNIKFNFAGGWGTKEDEEYFKQFVKEHKLDEIVFYNGLVHGNQKKSLFSQATLFVFPTQYKKEVFPLSLLEALSYGLPILTFNTGAISEIINNKIGVMSNKERIFDDLKIMIKNSQTESCYKICREEYLNKYTVEVFEKNLLSILINN